MIKIVKIIKTASFIVLLITMLLTAGCITELTRSSKEIIVTMEPGESEYWYGEGHWIKDFHDGLASVPIDIGNAEFIGVFMDKYGNITHYEGARCLMKIWNGELQKL